MTLIKSISGIRGTIGGQTGDTLNPLDIVKFTTAYATFISRKSGTSGKIVVGRDGRISGLMVRNVVVGTLMGMGYDVLDIGYASGGEGTYSMTGGTLTTAAGQGVRSAYVPRGGAYFRHQRGRFYHGV